MPIFTSTPGPVIIQDFLITQQPKTSVLNPYTISYVEQETKIYPWMGTHKLSKIDSSQTGVVNLQLSCTPASLNVIHQLGQYNGQPAPSWVQLDQATGVLRFNAPSVTQATTYNILVLTFIDDSTTPFERVFSLRVGDETSCPAGKFLLNGDCESCHSRCST